MKITLALFCFLFLHLTHGQNKPCDPAFYIWKNTDSIPAFSAKDTTLTVRFTNCISENIIIDSTKSVITGIVSMPTSYGDSLSKKARQCIELAQKNFLSGFIYIYYHSEKDDIKRISNLTISFPKPIIKEIKYETTIDDSVQVYVEYYNQRGRLDSTLTVNPESQLVNQYKRYTYNKDDSYDSIINYNEAHQILSIETFYYNKTRGYLSKSDKTYDLIHHYINNSCDNIIETESFKVNTGEFNLIKWLFEKFDGPYLKQTIDISDHKMVTHYEYDRQGILKNTYKEGYLQDDIYSTASKYYEYEWNKNGEWTKKSIDYYSDEEGSLLIISRRYVTYYQ